MSLNLPHTATIRKSKHVTTETLSTTVTDVDVSTGVKCWVQLASQREIFEANKLGREITHKVYFLNNPNLKENYTLEITASTTTDQGMVGKKMRYKSDADGTAGLGVFYKAFFDENQRPSSGAQE